MAKAPHITVLGGGPAGLAVGYFARRQGIDFHVYEAGAAVGGNAVTFRWGDFLYDSGAHRFHDKDHEITSELSALMGDQLVAVSAPSQIYFAGRYIDFPLSPLNLARRLGTANVINDALSFAAARCRGRAEDESFHALAVSRYGERLAERFLLGYSEKLWGAPARRLSPAVSGQRLKGLTLGTVIRETLFGGGSKTAHLDGTFYYPLPGFGAIAERLGQVCGAEHLRCNATVRRILHDGRRLQCIEFDGGERLAVDRVASTIPIDRFVSLLEPTLEPAVSGLAARLRFRDLILVALFIDRERITANASVYFPERHFPMTRICEPKNRSQRMSPPGKTSLLAEIPCDPGDGGHIDEDALIRRVSDHLIDIGWLEHHQILGHEVRRLSHAYPVLELEATARVARLRDALSRFENLQLVGRNATFTYTHMQDVLRAGRDAVAEIARLRQHRLPLASAA